MIKSLAHVCLKTTDLDRTTAFYCEGLGMEKLFSFTRTGKIIGFYLKASRTTFVEVFLADQAEPTTPLNALGHFCLETEAIEDLRHRLLERGCNPTPVKLGADQSFQFWVKDPNGVDLEFHQYTEQSAQFSGQDVEVNW